MAGVSFAGVSNYANVTTAQAFGVEATSQDAYGVSVAGPAYTGPLMDQLGDPLLTQSSLELLVE